ncbi:MAG: cbb3-type cytochrome c oxidase N-terminal domain-containing protein [Gemmatimonadales bacterium]
MSKPTSKNQVMGHADESDGIEEYDNALPNWWLGLFYLCHIWALAYVVHYHFIAKRSEVKTFAAEMAAASVRWPQQAAAAAATTVDLSEQSVEAGEAVFKVNCVACHGADMKGGIGPNLLDTTWIHGGTPEAILHTITVGVPEKGMLTWGPILGPAKVSQVAAYVVHQNREAVGSKE